MRLYDCEYRDGRAESAPTLRREQRGGMEIRQANRGGSVNMVFLPHSLDKAKMEAMHPTINAAEELECYEAELGGRDYLGEAGAKIAEEIEADAKRNGRRGQTTAISRPPIATTTSRTTTRMSSRTAS